jgi:hypothetical protein
MIIPFFIDQSVIVIILQIVGSTRTFKVGDSNGSRHQPAFSHANGLPDIRQVEQIVKVALFFIVSGIAADAVVDKISETAGDQVKVGNIRNMNDQLKLSNHQDKRSRHF